MSWSAETAIAIHQRVTPDFSQELRRRALDGKRRRSKRAIPYAEVARQLHNRKATRAA